MKLNETSIPFIGVFINPTLNVHDCFQSIVRTKFLIDMMQMIPGAYRLMPSVSTTGMQQV